MAVEIFRAQTGQDREELFRFRYGVYVEEMGRYRRTADHRGRRLVEPEDAHSVLYGARENGEVVGTSRLTLGADGFSPRQIEQYSLGPFLAEVPARLMAIGERLMVAPHLRGWAVASDLRELAREDVEAGGVRLVFGNCEPHLLSMNLSAGGRTYAEHNINSEEAGYLIPLVFLDGDTDGLAAAIGSLDGDGRPCLPRSIEAALARGDAVRSASVMAPGEYWAHVQGALERLEEQELHAFAGLDPSERRECISRSNIIECDPGDRVLKEGGSSQNLFLILDGTLEVRHRDRLVNVLGPGDVFGEMAFLLELPRQSDVYAATPGVRIMSLSDGTLRKLMAEEPSLAAKLLLNISRMLCGRLIKANAGADILRFEIPRDALMLNLTNLAKFVNVDRVSMTYGIGKGMTQLSRLVHMAEEVVLRRGRRPVVRLVPIVAGEDGAKRKPGRMRDRISMSEDFDEWPEDVARALGIVN